MGHSQLTSFFGKEALENAGRNGTVFGSFLKGELGLIKRKKEAYKGVSQVGHQFEHVGQSEAEIDLVGVGQS